MGTSCEYVLNNPVDGLCLESVASRRVWNGRDRTFKSIDVSIDSISGEI